MSATLKPSINLKPQQPMNSDKPTEYAIKLTLGTFTAVRRAIPMPGSFGKELVIERLNWSLQNSVKYLDSLAMRYMARKCKFGDGRCLAKDQKVDVCPSCARLPRYMFAIPAKGGMLPWSDADTEWAHLEEAAFKYTTIPSNDYYLRELNMTCWLNQRPDTWNAPLLLVDLREFKTEKDRHDFIRAFQWLVSQCHRGYDRETGTNLGRCCITERRNGCASQPCDACKSFVKRKEREAWNRWSAENTKEIIDYLERPVHAHMHLKPAGKETSKEAESEQDPDGLATNADSKAEKKDSRSRSSSVEYNYSPKSSRTRGRDRTTSATQDENDDDEVRDRRARLRDRSFSRDKRPRSRSRSASKTGRSRSPAPKADDRDLSPAARRARSQQEKEELGGSRQRTPSPKTKVKAKAKAEKKPRKAKKVMKITIANSARPRRNSGKLWKVSVCDSFSANPQPYDVGLTGSCFRWHTSNPINFAIANPQALYPGCSSVGGGRVLRDVITASEAFFNNCKNRYDTPCLLHTLEVCKPCDVCSVHSFFNKHNNKTEQPAASSDARRWASEDTKLGLALFDSKTLAATTTEHLKAPKRSERAQRPKAKAAPSSSSSAAAVPMSDEDPQDQGVADREVPEVPAEKARDQEMEPEPEKKKKLLVTFPNKKPAQPKSRLKITIKGPKAGGMKVTISNTNASSTSAAPSPAVDTQVTKTRGLKVKKSKKPKVRKNIVLAASPALLHKSGPQVDSGIKVTQEEFNALNDEDQDVEMSAVDFDDDE